MSSPRVLKIYEGMVDQLKKLGQYSSASRESIRWIGRVASGAHAGKDAMLLDIDSAAWADNNKRAILLAKPASDKSGTQAMKTQSHASGHFLDGSVSFEMYMETPESWTDEQARFQRIMMHQLVGQLGAPVQLFLCANDTEPTIEGVNGAGASASYTSAGVYLPYSMAVVGGV